MSHQYRMCDDVMLLCNTLVYQGRLRCASPQVAHARLAMPHLAMLPGWCQGPGQAWLLQALQPQRAVVFLDTDLVCTPPAASPMPFLTAQVPAPETHVGEAVITRNTFLMLACPGGSPTHHHAQRARSAT